MAIPAARGEKPRLDAPTTGAEIAKLIADLGDPAYMTRAYATRRLAAIGTTAYDQVKAASIGDDPETAMRARRILAIYDRLLFFNAEVTVSFSRSKIAWTDPVDLVVTVTNRGKHSLKVPFAIKSSERENRSADALQVADMLDIGDFIHVRNPQGKNVDLRVDEISLDPDIVAVVQQRLNGGPFAEVAAGQRVTLTVHDFNRGWARYPLLEAGEYSVTFEYIPDWRDPELEEASAGRIVSAPTTVTVVDSAPAEVSRNGIEADCRLAREGDFLVAYLVNRTDHVAVVNRNFGNSLPFARGDWVFESGPVLKELSAERQLNQTWKDFRVDNLTEVAPGGSLEIARVNLKKLRKRFADVGVDLAGETGSVHFQYSNACDRLWQSRERAILTQDGAIPKVLRDPLPRRLLSTRQSSNRLHVMDLR